MKFNQILTWFIKNLKEIRKSQRKTLANIVIGLMLGGKAGVAAIGRTMQSQTTPKHNIKRVARFLANDRINIKKSMIKLQSIILNKSTKLYIALDWTIHNDYQILEATVVGEGRGIPIAFKTYKNGTIKDNQTKYEKKMLLYLKKLIPNNIEVIIIADRGFGQKSELAKFIEKCHFYYVLRNKDDNSVECKEFKGIIKNFKTEFGKVYHLKNVIWPRRQTNKSGKKIKSDFIITQKIGMKERWILNTNIKFLRRDGIVKIYSKRMTIEETFKDKKNVDLGFRLNNLKLSSADRYDRMLLVISYAYFLLTMLGALIEKNGLHKTVMANTVKYRAISLFRLGQHFLNQKNYTVPYVLKMILFISFKLE